MTKAEKAEREEAIARLREALKPGDTVHTILRHVSRSGMQREISAVITGIDDDGKPYIWDISWLSARILGNRQGKSCGVIMGGCGMDMGFDLVYILSCYLFPDGFGIEGRRKVMVKGEDGKRHAEERRQRPASKEEAARMVKEGWRFHGRNGDASGWDNDGGYALSQRWM